MNFSGHRHVTHVIAAEILDGVAELGQSHPGEVVAQPGQGRVGMPFHTQAIDLVTLATERFGDDHRVASPAGENADSTRSGG